MQLRIWRTDFNGICIMFPIRIQNFLILVPLIILVSFVSLRPHNFKPSVATIDKNDAMYHSSDASTKFNNIEHSESFIKENYSKGYNVVDYNSLILNENHLNGKIARNMDVQYKPGCEIMEGSKSNKSLSRVDLLYDDYHHVDEECKLKDTDDVTLATEALTSATNTNNLESDSFYTASTPINITSTSPMESTFATVLTTDSSSETPIMVSINSPSTTPPTESNVFNSSLIDVCRTFTFSPSKNVTKSSTTKHSNTTDNSGFFNKVRFTIPSWFKKTNSANKSQANSANKTNTRIIVTEKIPQTICYEEIHKICIPVGNATKHNLTNHDNNSTEGHDYRLAIYKGTGKGNKVYPHRHKGGDPGNNYYKKHPGNNNNNNTMRKFVKKINSTLTPITENVSNAVVAITQSLLLSENEYNTTEQQTNTTLVTLEILSTTTVDSATKTASKENSENQMLSTSIFSDATDNCVEDDEDVKYVLNIPTTAMYQETVNLNFNEEEPQNCSDIEALMDLNPSNVSLGQSIILITKGKTR